MSVLNRATQRRLQRLKQISAIWEGDQRPLPSQVALGGAEEGLQCVLWVDVAQSAVRAMDMVELGAGPEVVVRTLLRAIETPQSPALPARPKRLLVRNRELQFFLRGVLQDLGITVDYAPELPFIDEIFDGLAQQSSASTPTLPPAAAQPLFNLAEQLWRRAPWEFLWDHEVISVEIQSWDTEPLYATVMGRLGMERGVIFYRSRDSLLRFRQQIVDQEDDDHDTEAVFLSQDCLFLLFDQVDEVEEADISFAKASGWQISEVYPVFGSLHPLEGGRPFLYDEEASVLQVALTALTRFLKQHTRQLETGDFPKLQSQCRIPSPVWREPGPNGPQLVERELRQAGELVTVAVETLPNLADSLVNLSEPDLESEMLVLREDLLPEDALIKLDTLPRILVESLRQDRPVDSGTASNPVIEGDQLPVLLVQTSRPKALDLITQIKEAGGLKAIAFNPGESLLGDVYELGVIQTNDGNLHLFGEFENQDRSYTKAKRRWEKTCQKTSGYCGLVVAMGATGQSRGNPQPRHLLAFFDAQALPATELGLGVLQALPWVEPE
ncbi:DUF6930 domain-containing protein [Leptolyngbya sp. FACHB-261]|uniref:DUF6930 domain-containing protein n=1 Tax=Leptolyngbya sp. FACHB-261 TaxID=2692806 RepID=UPI001681D836|nr:hypothetical protein [Leptolyngbya sp. FACHB-261]MBD2103709.1 hypothetical protein [Leptolyngbya sp. FACHB-261]